ncbi:hypothetical protein [Wocania ichthyoenteri]|uniref:hypothetical protein n=1 Tax=Wocania ichthyoenteri TaxID=1230531 RepID=UPI00053EEC5D|nr:hypothetical protein [Wocania ichthyoenteri]
MKIENSIIIEASLVKELDKAWLLDCEGDKVWFPKSKCNFDNTKKELEAPKWLLQEKFPTENF